MKLRFLPPQRNEAACEQIEREHEERLQDAENRANVLIRTAEWLQAAVAKRDQENSWQRSVNQLFLGDSS